ncbi:SpoIVB peptidase S55 domain-containing protein [Lysinibacillus louembei]|uniref:SpoIVB peptidase S55 domain-containing protein n=1 Tax=Lysinibacillus louembei TaxID=1470088 RepID=A0ABZ0RS26_9BACI|nr:SpoIVB peptidase S55 domain-containing protein [Lysinibacillus louembei]WPK10935.1 SpoIVB peptidase S55 domain-containing protein [Lysinibacillus louembei]
MCHLRNLLLVIFFILIPVQVSAKELIPMGQSIGIQLKLPFIYVSHDILLPNGEWLKQGDKVLAVDEQEINQIQQFAEIKEPSALRIERANKEKVLNLTSEEIQNVLPFLKDETDGIGTLTFLDPTTNEYGALGHQIVDSALTTPPPFIDGAIFLASISQVKKSEPGQPGYKISIVNKDRQRLGNVLFNNVYGVFGEWEQGLSQSLRQPMEIMHDSEIKRGEAQMLTAIEGEKVEKFAITIDKVDGANIVFRVTDPKLLSKTGGILQGMSGSPIIQNDRFVGAVTHMFVEHPAKGAALSIGEMLKKSPK